METRGGGGRCFNWLVLNAGKPGMTAPGGKTETMLGRTWLGSGGGGTAWITAGGGMLVGGADCRELDDDDCCWLDWDC